MQPLICISTLLIIFKFQLVVSHNASASVRHKTLGYPMNLIYYNSVIQINCSATEKMRIELKNPKNVTINSTNGKDLIHELIADKTFKLFGKYKCMFDGKSEEIYTIRIPYRFCSPDEYNGTYPAKTKRKCRSASLCVIHAGIDPTDTCTYFSKHSDICPLFFGYPHSTDQRFYSPNHLCVKPSVPGSLCNLMTNRTDQAIPGYETSSDCRDFVQQMDFGLYVKEESAKILSGKLPDTSTNDLNTQYYLLPIGSTIFVDKFPFNIIYKCYTHISEIYTKWLYGFKSYQCINGTCRISIEKDFDRMNDENLVDFIVTGNTADRHQFSTYGTFLFMSEKLLCHRMTSQKQQITILSCSFEGGKKKLLLGFAFRIRWQVNGNEIKSEYGYELIIPVDTFPDDKEYVCVGEIIYEAYASQGWVKFEKSIKEHFTSNNCAEIKFTIGATNEIKKYITDNTTVSATPENEKYITGDPGDFYMSLAYILIGLISVIVLGIIIYAAIHFYRRQKLRQMIASSTIGSAGMTENLSVLSEKETSFIAKTGKTRRPFKSSKFQNKQRSQKESSKQHKNRKGKKLV